MSFIWRKNCVYLASFWQFPGTTPLVSFNDSIDFVQQSQWFCSTIPMALFQQSAAFARCFCSFACSILAYLLDADNGNRSEDPCFCRYEDANGLRLLSEKKEPPALRRWLRPSFSSCFSICLFNFRKLCLLLFEGREVRGEG